MEYGSALHPDSHPPPKERKRTDFPLQKRHRRGGGAGDGGGGGTRARGAPGGRSAALTDDFPVDHFHHLLLELGVYLLTLC